MSVLFLKLLNMSLVASWTILALLLLRPLFKKAPRWIVCIMWAIVGVRLIMPISFESVFSLLPTIEPIPEEILEQSETSEHVSKEQEGISYIGEGDGPILFVSREEIEGEISFPETSHMTPATPGAVDKDKVVFERLLALTSAVWILGIVGMAIYAIYSYLRVYFKVRSSVMVGANVYINDGISTPFILGLFRPRIYMPSAMNEDEQKHVLLHERAHLARLDHIWKPLGYAVLMIHWFNPLIWFAYYLLCKDIEFACDERAIKKLNACEKVAYTTVLLQCSVQHKMIAACPLAFGEVRVKERIKTVLHYKKPTFWIIIVAVIACIIFAAAFLTDPKAETTSSEPQDENSTEISSIEASSQDVSSAVSEESAYPEESSEPEQSADPEESSEPEAPPTVPPDGEVKCVFNSFEVWLFNDLNQFVQAIEIAGCKYTSQVECGYPIVKFENYQQLSVFAKTLKEGCAQRYVSYFDLGDTLERYNEQYFKNNDLVIVYTGESSGGNRNHLQSVLRNGETLSIAFLKTMGWTDDSIELFNCLEFPKKEITYCNNFVLDITQCFIDKPMVKNSQNVLLTDTELDSYLDYLNKELMTETFLLCLDTAEDVNSLVGVLGEDSDFVSKLAVYNAKFFENNSLYLFYSQEATASDTLQISDETKTYHYYDYDYAVLHRELQIKINHFKTASDDNRIPQILMFGLWREDYDDVSYSVTSVEEP